MQDHTDQIVKLLSQKDEKAIDLIYEHFGPNLYGYVLKIVKDEALARDVIQDSFVKIWRYSDKYDPKKSKLFTWMMNICRNQAIDRLRGSKTNLTVDIQNMSSNVYVYGISQINVDHIDLKDKVNGLEDKYKQVIEVLFFQGMTQREASKLLDIPLGTIKSRLKIALRELQLIFKNKNDILNSLLAFLWMIE